MNFRLFERPLTGSAAAVILLLTAAISFGQTPGNTTPDPAVTVSTVKASAAKVDTNKTLAAIEKFAPETANNSTKKDEAPVTGSPQAASSPKWEFAVAPYLYLTALSGDVGANGRTATIDQSIGDVLSHFKAGFMGTIEARRGRFVMLNDLMWTKLTEETNTPGRLYNTGKVSVNMTVFNPQAGIRVVEKKGGSFDILGGLRVTSVKNILSFTTGILPGFTAEARKTWAAPTIGGHGVVNLSDKVYLSTIFDVGGGFGTHVTGQFYGGMGYRIKPKIAMLFGYRFLKNDYSDDAGFIYNTNMNGIVLGTRFNF